MNCPTLSQLPPPPPGRTGWPWTEETLQHPEMMPDGSRWPRVTIVTPSFNQAQFLEETIRSVLVQGYPDLEYIIMDGGSMDGSIEIIQKYAPWLAYWESEKDRGQSHAINKGWAKATGEVLAWLNSDDVYTPGALYAAVQGLCDNSETGMVYSDFIFIDEHSTQQRAYQSRPLDLKILLGEGTFIAQPTVFLKRKVIEVVGMLDESLHMVMDLDLWLRIIVSQKYRLEYLGGTSLAWFRKHTTSKTVSQAEAFIQEKKYLGDKVYSMPGLPYEIRAMKSHFYGLIYFQGASVQAAGGHSAATMRYLMKALFANPAYVFGHPLASLGLVKKAALGIFISYR